MSKKTDNFAFSNSHIPAKIYVNVQYIICTVEVEIL